MATRWLEIVFGLASQIKPGVDQFLCVSVSVLYSEKSPTYIIAIVVVDCGDPGLPANAARTFTQSTFNSVVTYTCNVNFMLSGESVRRCQADGTWSGTLPSCERMLTPRTITLTLQINS